jgi:hypothetical protein
MSTLSGSARKFFDACETGKGWAECRTKIWNDGITMRQLGWVK